MHFPVLHSYLRGRKSGYSLLLSCLKCLKSEMALYKMLCNSSLQKQWRGETYTACKIMFGPGIPGRLGHRKSGCQDVPLMYHLQISKYLSAITCPVLREGKAEAWMNGREFLSSSSVVKFLLFCICCRFFVFHVMFQACLLC